MKLNLDFTEVGCLQAAAAFAGAYLPCGLFIGMEGVGEIFDDKLLSWRGGMGQPGLAAAGKVAK